MLHTLGFPTQAGVKKKNFNKTELTVGKQQKKYASIL
jgi:hypothetical protein